jgi:ABC-type uncharacterized transport system permease subunit
MVLTLSLLKLGRSLWPIPDVGFVPLAVTAGAGTFFLTALLLQHSAAWEALSAGRGALKRLQR